jgi:hypothetical protein
MSTTKKKVTNKAPKKVVKTKTLYAYVSPETKTWLTQLCKNQVGNVSKSTMVEKIFHALRTKPEVLKELSL